VHYGSPDTDSSNPTEENKNQCHVNNNSHVASVMRAFDDVLFHSKGKENGKEERKIIGGIKKNWISR
jgi:hypothetical protein